MVTCLLFAKLRFHSPFSFKTRSTVLLLEEKNNSENSLRFENSSEYYFIKLLKLYINETNFRTRAAELSRAPSKNLYEFTVSA